MRAQWPHENLPPRNLYEPAGLFCDWRRWRGPPAARRTPPA